MPCNWLSLAHSAIGGEIDSDFPSATGVTLNVIRSKQGICGYNRIIDLMYIFSENMHFIVIVFFASFSPQGCAVHSTSAGPA